MYNHGYSQMFVTVVLSLSHRIYSVIKCKKVFIYRVFVRVIHLQYIIVQCTIHLMDKPFLIWIKRGSALSKCSRIFWIFVQGCENIFSIHYTAIRITHIHVLNTLRQSLMCQKYRYASFILFASKRYTNQWQWWYEMRWNVKWKNFIFLFQPTKEEKNKREMKKRKKVKKKTENLRRVSGEFQIIFSLLIKCYRIISRLMDIILFYAP